MIEGLRMMLGEGPQLAYLSYMANRLVECHRVLKSTGSLYLHCDPTMSHYLKTVMDGIFDRKNFRSEVIWRRTNAHNKTTRQYGPIHETILFYSITDKFTFHPGRTPYSKAYIEERFKHTDERGRYQTNYLTGPGKRNGASGKTWGGFDPTAVDRHWAIPRSLREYLPNAGASLRSQEALDALYAQGLIVFPKKRGGQPMYKQYMGDGVQYQDIWAYQPNTQGVLHDANICIDQDVKYLEHEDEKLGYPTQKPIGLLQRIIETSSTPGDVVLDPFCGCGTTVHAAQNLGRRWIGIDVCVNACKVIEQRLRSHFDTIWDEVEFIGMPKTSDDAKTLADLDKFRFERWAASLVDGMEANTRQRGDGGIDGWGRIPIRKGQFIDMVSQVKGGGTGPGDVQAFTGARQQARADLGIFTCFDERVTPRMRDAAASTGRFMEVPTVQIYTVEDYFEGRVPALPRVA